MTSRQFRLALAQDDLVRRGMADVREQLDIPAQFPPDVLAAAEQAAEQHFGPGRVDRTGTPFVIQDPAVRARAKGDLSVGSHAEVSLMAADPATRRVQFEAATG